MHQLITTCDIDLFLEAATSRKRVQSDRIPDNNCLNSRPRIPLGKGPFSKMRKLSKLVQDLAFSIDLECAEWKYETSTDIPCDD